MSAPALHIGDRLLRIVFTRWPIVAVDIGSIRQFIGRTVLTCS